MGDRSLGGKRSTAAHAEMGMRTLMCYQMLLVAGICVLSMTAAEEVGMLDSVPSSPPLSIGGDMKREEESLLQVTPQIPDGPVVAKFKKMKAKKKLDKQIVTQSKVMKPMLKRKKVKKRAQKNK